jgi:hypothetical protein
MPDEIIQCIGSFIQEKKDIVAFAITCKTTQHFFQPVFEKFDLIQSVIDEDKETMKKLLDKKPELLIKCPKKNYVIQSKKTWQKFCIEEPLTMASKRGQLEMVKLMLPYFEKLEKCGILKDSKAEILSQLILHETNAKEKEQYSLKMKSLIAVIAKEKFLNGNENSRLIDQINQETQEALGTFRKELLPDMAITLDHYFNINELLISAYTTYNNHFKTLHDWNQRALYCVGVLGFLQSLLTPEIAKVLCVGLSKVVREDASINDRTIALNLADNTPFYRTAKLSCKGIGFDFLVNSAGVTDSFRIAGRIGYSFFLSDFKNYVEKKQLNLVSLREKLKQDQSIVRQHFYYQKV